VTDTPKSALDRLSASDVEIVRQCLAATVAGPFFPDWEFHILFGLERDEVAELLDRWPDPANPEDQDLAVNNALSWLLGYPHGQEQAWSEFISAPPSEVAAVLTRWRGDDAWDASPRGSFDRLR
jgi:hypothetical protein